MKSFSATFTKYANIVFFIVLCVVLNEQILPESYLAGLSLICKIFSLAITAIIKIYNLYIYNNSLVYLIRKKGTYFDLSSH